MIVIVSAADMYHIDVYSFFFAIVSQPISLFSKMCDKGDGGVKNLKKWVTLFMDGPI